LTTEQYKEVIWCYYDAMSKEIDGVITKGTFMILRSRNPYILPV